MPAAFENTNANHEVKHLSEDLVEGDLTRTRENGMIFKVSRRIMLDPVAGTPDEIDCYKKGLRVRLYLVSIEDPTVTDAINY
jgi:hypothetical protein